MIGSALTVVKQQFNQQRYYYVSNVLLNYNKHRHNDKFEIDDLVVYYVGERNYPMRKIRSRFTGPFRVIKRINHNTVTIYNEETQQDISCHTQKLKKFHPNEFTKEQDYLRQLKQQQKLNNEYIRKKSHLRKKL